ncbi:hypothetical protein AGMMS50268_17170 [Spirochaetia bacterium]|nr:hypothetical protein AGMMS50268_17170 [Spirochaetia bacterium]
MEIGRDEDEEKLYKMYMPAAVEARSLDDFVDRFGSPSRLSLKDKDAREKIIRKLEREFKKDGYVIISMNKSIKRETVAWYGPGTNGRDLVKKFWG